MDTLYMAGHFARSTGQWPYRPRSEDSFYATYSPRSLRQLMPALSAVAAVGGWLVVLGLFPG